MVNERLYVIQNKVNRKNFIIFILFTVLLLNISYYIKNDSYWFYRNPNNDQQRDICIYASAFGTLMIFYVICMILFMQLDIEISASTSISYLILLLLLSIVAFSLRYYGEVVWSTIIILIFCQMNTPSIENVKKKVMIIFLSPIIIVFIVSLWNYGFLTQSLYRDKVFDDWIPNFLKDGVDSNHGVKKYIYLVLLSLWSTIIYSSVLFIIPLILMFGIWYLNDNFFYACMMKIYYLNIIWYIVPIVIIIRYMLGDKYHNNGFANFGVLYILYFTYMYWVCLVIITEFIFKCKLLLVSIWCGLNKYINILV